MGRPTETNHDIEFSFCDRLDGEATPFLGNHHIAKSLGGLQGRQGKSVWKLFNERDFDHKPYGVGFGALGVEVFVSLFPGVVVGMGLP